MGQPDHVARQQGRDDAVAVKAAGFGWCTAILGSSVAYSPCCTYGSIRMHHLNVWGADLVNPDFARLAQSYGVWRGGRAHEGHCRRLRKGASIEVAALLGLRVSPEALSPRMTISLASEGREMMPNTRCSR
jgi:hypothetical protein